MRLAQLLRLTAIGIALLGWLDPPVVVSPLPPVTVSLALARGALDRAPVAGDDSTTRAAAADLVAETIVKRLGTRGDVRVTSFEDPHRVPCGLHEACVVIGDGSLHAELPADRSAPVSRVRIGRPLSPNASVVTVTAVATHAAAEGRARVVLEGAGLNGRTSRIELRDGAAVVGEATHAWREDSRASVDLVFWPLDAGHRTLDVVLTTDGVAERTTLDNLGSAIVDVGRDRWPVLVYERRPSWAGTFLRRALEADPRFDVSARTDLAPAVSVNRSASGAPGPSLDVMRVVIVAAPESLDGDDVSRLDAYVRRRGGALVLTPDRGLQGPITRLVPGSWHERMTDPPAPAGPLVAGEWLVARGMTALDEVWLQQEGAPVVVASPVGNGIVLVSGAMDAWRHRGSGEDFDRFWRSAVAQVARLAGAEVDVSVDEPAARPGGRVRVHVQARSTRSPGRWRAMAWMRCGDAPEVFVRLWPSDAPGSFEGVARPRPEGARCSVRARVDPLGEGTAAMSVTRHVTSDARPTEASLESVVARTGGVDVTADDLDPLVKALLSRSVEPLGPERRYPMRSAWWILPFVGCLAGEWWLRRLSGRR
jgi:hypothetical protein